MDAYLLLSLEMLVSVAASMIVLRILAAPLSRTLEHICPDEQSASFWLSYTRVMLVIAPLILVLIVDSFSRYSAAPESLRMTVLATLTGLLLGMYLLGKRMGAFIRSRETAENGK